MTQKTSRMVRVCMVAALSLGAFAGVADAAGMSNRQCRMDWRAHKATYRAQGQSRRKFLRACRSGTMQPSTPAPATTTTTH
ncbi:MAG: hypothetical protein ACLPWS_23230 [Rhodomicrobium sp.]